MSEKKSVMDSFREVGNLLKADRTFDAINVLFDIYIQDYSGSDGNHAKNNIISLAKNKQLSPKISKLICLNCLFLPR